MTVYRSGTKALIRLELPRQARRHSRHLAPITLYDLKAGTSFSWDPAATPIACSAGTFSGDWGDPYAMTAELNTSIAKGDLKPPAQRPSTESPPRSTPAHQAPPASKPGSTKKTASSSARRLALPAVPCRPWSTCKGLPHPATVIPFRPARKMRLRKTAALPRRTYRRRNRRQRRQLRQRHLRPRLQKLLLHRGSRRRRQNHGPHHPPVAGRHRHHLRHGHPTRPPTALARATTAPRPSPAAAFTRSPARSTTACCASTIRPPTSTSV